MHEYQNDVTGEQFTLMLPDLTRHQLNQARPDIPRFRVLSYLDPNHSNADNAQLDQRRIAREVYRE